MKKTNLFAVLIMFSLGFAKAQIAGVFTVPGSYTSVAAAVIDLNTQGVNGAVTINIAAGYTETAPVGGYTLTVTGTAANPITFQKSGAGANPLLTAYTGGVGLPSTAVQDGIWSFIGSDYITMNGIDLIDPNTTNPSLMEFGYGFFKASLTDGCQYNTIKNCVITLNRNNVAFGVGAASDGSRGIDMVDALFGAHTNAISPTSIAGSNSFNKFYNNTIQNCGTCIALIGFADVSPFTFADYGNDVGGISSATSNTLINFGGGASATTPAAGIKTAAQYNFNASYNSINNNDGSGLNHITNIRGIYVLTAPNANSTVSSNTITIKTSVTNQQVSMIENLSGGSGVNNTITITNNLIANCTNTNATSSTWYGINNNSMASCAHLNISGNTFTNNTTYATIASGLSYLLYNGASVSSSISFLNNTLSFSHTGSTAYPGSVYSIFNGGSTTTTTLNINNNNFVSYNYNLTASGGLYFIYNNANNYALNINNNLCDNLTLKHSSTVSFITNPTATQYALSVVSNSFTNITRTGAAGSMNGYNGSGGPLGTCTQTISNNLISNISATVAGTGTFWGINVPEGNVSPYPRKTITTNTVSNINYNTNNNAYGMLINYLGDGTTTQGSIVKNNLVSNITTNGALYGLHINTVVSPNYPAVVSNNTINALTSSAASTPIYGCFVASGGAGINFFKNKIYDITQNNATGTAYGIYANNTTTSNIYNNLIGNIYTPAASGINKVNGIYVLAAAGNNINLYFNTIYLSGTSSGSDFGSNALYVATPANVNLRNNIFVNMCIPTGTETAVAYRRSTSTLATYSATSNNNLFYAGVPSANHLIYHDATTPLQTLANYKALVSPRDGVSVTENPTFVSTAGSSLNFLNINTSTPTQIESGAAPISGIVDDYNGTIRSTILPDIGAWEGIYTPVADLLPPAFLANGFTNSACNLTSRTYTMNITDVTGVAGGLLSPRSYYKVNSNPYVSTQGTLTAGTAQNGVWTFSMSYVGAPNDVISYYTVAQDIITIPNIDASPNTAFTANDVNTITNAPTNPSTFALVPTLAGTYSVGATGNFTTLTQAANVYNTSCLGGPITFVLIDPVYSTSETFPIVFSNNPDANSTNSLLIVPAPALAVTISGSNTAKSTIKFLNSKYITLDGLNTGGSSIAIYNPSTVNAAVIWLASTSGIGPGNTTIGIKNLTITGGSNAQFNFGIAAGVDGTNPSTTGGIDNDNISIQSNTILTASHGISAVGTATTSAGLDNWIISNNAIGPVSSSTANIGLTGILLNYLNGVSVINNTVSNVSDGAVAAYRSGINLNQGVRNATVNLNTVYAIKYTGTGGYGGIGIEVNVNNTISNVTIRNNMVSDCGGDGKAGWTSGAFSGIRVAANFPCSGIIIQNNSVSMNQYTTIAGYNAGILTAALYLGPNATNVDVRNNLLHSNIQYTNAGAKTYAIYSDAPPTAYINIDNNDYFTSGTQANLSYISTANQTNLAMLVSAFGQNANSQNVAPVFAGPTNLHLVPLQNAQIDNTGTPIAGITVDIDIQTRSITTPDMGADEFTTPNCSLTVVASPSTICSGNTATLTASGVDSYTWNTTATTSVITDAPTSTTIYTLTGYSNLCAQSYTASATVSVNTTPTINAVASNTTICEGKTVSLTASGASSYTWSTSSNNATIVDSPTSTTVYTVTGSDNNCDVTKTININVNPKPVLTISVPGATACLNGGAITLTGTPSGGVFSGPNITGNVLNPTALGTFAPAYSFTNIVTGCSNSTSVSVTVVDCTGLNENGSIVNSISVFPNPNNGSFTIKTTNTFVKIIEMTDLTGRVISSEKTNADTINMNISKLANGVYQVKVRSETGTDIIKVIKQ